MAERQTQPIHASWLDRVVGFLAPEAGLRRLRARVAADTMLRHYEAASQGRRTQGWRRSSGDANVAVASGLTILREVVRDLVRNNPHAKRAVGTIANQVVGWGITAKPNPLDKRAAAAWKAWAESTACDADGRHNFYGLQKLVMRTVVESGECLVRRRLRLPEDGFPLPLQLQVLEPDYLDTARTGERLQGGGRIIHGVEYNVLGRRVAYYLFPEHPGSSTSMFTAGSLGGSSRRVPAESVVHVFDTERPGQVRGVSWYSSVVLKIKDFDEYDDAQLMKQKIAACLAVITSDVDGSAPALGARDSSMSPELDMLEPGMIVNAPPGRTINVVEPPRVGEFADYSEVTLRAIATGLGVTYEDLTGDYTELPFSAARMSRLAHWARVDEWRWQMLIPQLCDPVWAWAMQAAEIMGQVGSAPGVAWTAPPMPMIEPDKEGLATQRNVRTGIQTMPEAIRERGYDPDELLAEMAAWNKKLDKLGLVLDSDPRTTTQAGQPRQTVQPAAKEPPEPPPASTDKETPA